MFERFALHPFCRHTRVSEFVAGLEEGRLLASVCDDCGHRSFPPRADCESCRGERFDLVEIEGTGTVLSHTTVRAAPAGFEAQSSYTLAVVELDTGGRALAPVHDFDRPISIGDRVRLRPATLDVDGSRRATYFVHPLEASHEPHEESNEESP